MGVNTEQDSPSGPGGLLRTHGGLRRLLMVAAVCMCIFWYFMLLERPLERAGHHCVDLAPNCKAMVGRGLCKADRPLMKKQCAASCGMCGHHHTNCIDQNSNCEGWSKSGECERNPLFMMKSCQRSCGGCVSCLSIVAPAFADPEYLSISDTTSNGKPIFASSIATLSKERTGLWTVRRRNGEAIITQSEPTESAYDESAVGGWKVSRDNGTTWVDSNDVIVSEANCATAKRKIVLPDQVRNARQTIKTPVKGVDFEADYDINNLKPAPPSYAYPTDTPPAFLYPEDVKDAPDIPYYIMSYMPKVYYFPRFVSDEEADNVMEEADKRLQRSGVVPIKGKSATGYDNVRTSYGCWLDNSHKSVEDIRRRVLAVTGFNTTQTEKLQVLRYNVGGKYESHHDFYQSHGATSLKESEEMWRVKWNKNWNRAATFFLYLADTEEGGETTLPRANGGPNPSSMRDCTKGLRVRPKKGAAVLFYDMKPNKETDDFSLHGGCPVKKGVKWGAPQWLHVKVREGGAEDNFW
eukprot:TRINITY_DN65681_c0_g1_i1.p1 TRINITY_DN65681_c0_g1~~TRINITY_DN65681_c0_g1_i1.p1  ORF type:complete len:542 (+),score=178.32 TRINITY_DN65681_c0_g1_i1:63-1628(+)